MTQYKINYKKGGYKAGEEIQPEKVTTAERIGGAMIKGLIILTAALFIFNLIRFIF